MAAQGAGNNSSDFVRKLYKMLEDPSYKGIVRWGNEGDSFVVLENEKFTKTILPKHFKHSNFASFVRQLNKYDFHKVRQNEESGTSPYGPNAWEFKHPEFHQHKKDNLDNIRRKAPAPRKAAVADEAITTPQIIMIQETLSATQHQVQQLQEQSFNLHHQNRLLVDEVVSLQKMVKLQNQVHHELLTHLSSIDERRRNSRHSAHSSHSGIPGQFQNIGMLPDSTDEPAAELRRARDLLKDIAPETATHAELEKMNAMYQGASPPDSAGSSSIIYNPAGPAAAALGSESLNEMRHLVYPAGQNTGIDPFHSDHIHNIPYTRPPSNPSGIAEMPAQLTPPISKEWSEWGPKKPRILLVEDDKICARIGAKFLSQYDCTVIIAREGQDAVQKVNTAEVPYDLIFMDIIMPVYDGVSATACIRLVQPQVPIIAMTSNIRSEDVALYFRWGMNDVLAKPFTKDGMIRILRKHLQHLARDPQPPGALDDLPQPSPLPPGMHQGAPGYTSAAMTMAGGPVTAGGPVPIKYEHSPPGQSPSGSNASWHSPSMEGTYIGAGMGMNGGGQMPLTPGGTQRPNFTGPPPPTMQQPPTTRGLPDGLAMGEERPEKRARYYGPGQSQYSQ